jgi:Fe2+ or Zn2+ uptake regulation protein
MKVARDEIQERMTRVRPAIRRAGTKLTHQRLEIFAEVARTGEHRGDALLCRRSAQTPRMAPPPLDRIFDVVNRKP